MSPLGHRNTVAQRKNEGVSGLAKAHAERPAEPCSPALFAAVLSERKDFGAVFREQRQFPDADAEVQPALIGARRP